MAGGPFPILDRGNCCIEVQTLFPITSSNLTEEVTFPVFKEHFKEDSGPHFLNFFCRPVLYPRVVKLPEEKRRLPSRTGSKGRYGKRYLIGITYTGGARGMSVNLLYFFPLTYVLLLL